MALPVVIGKMQRSSPSQRSWALPVNRSSSAAGNSERGTGGSSVPLAARQNGVAGNSSHHHRRQRPTVRRLTPTNASRWRIRAGVGPQRSAAISTTTAPKWTLRPRNRNEGGVARWRQSRAAQQKLDLIHAGRLDEAERAARELLLRYPEVPDGHDRLGMVHEARGQKRDAADCYRERITAWCKGRRAECGRDDEDDDAEDRSDG